MSNLLTRAYRAFVVRKQSPAAALLSKWRYVPRRYYRWRYRAKIISTAECACDTRMPYEVHILTQERDVIEALWALKTFYRFSGDRPVLYVHEDGTLSARSKDLFRAHFPGCEVIDKSRADEQVKEFLHGYPYSYRFRFDPHAPSWHCAVIGIKLFDFMFYSRTKAYLALDSDVLFFRTPEQILRCIGQGQGFVSRDYLDSYCFTRERLQEWLGLQVRPRINAGLMFMPSGQWYDRDLIEWCCRKCYEEPGAIGVFAEQTSMALIASKYPQKFELLDEHYQLGKYARLDERTVSFHYVQDGSRDDYYRLGVKRLVASKFLKWSN